MISKEVKGQVEKRWKKYAQRLSPGDPDPCSGFLGNRKLKNCPKFPESRRQRRHIYTLPDSYLDYEIPYQI